ncbi:telomeric repeat-binding factor 1 isoform X1 [Archocentrus centrarchus]|uniref:telomeric repeat-binding factor 1 isoform X1 n=1 Tax=Archocentrus centrarchus TaxID=63155 RepID=UPI0011EA31A6|nr:telomeric repeat-binding factor 1 isoform X1 [Archocentrus centrarchus]
MAAENNNRTVADEDNVGESISFSHVTAVATGWMLDFMFLSLCRRFKKGKRDEFSETHSAFRAIHQTSSLKVNEKAKICAFLARVMDGKLLDVQFEDDDSVMPLMSAAKIWSDLEHTVSDQSLFKNITILLVVQSVAVCLEKGQRSSASSALRWFENNLELPQGLGVKLSKIVEQRETYHPFLMSFSFSRLLETVQSYLDAYLEKNPSDYLLKAATKMVQSSQNAGGLEDVESQSSSLSKKANDVTEDRKKRESIVCRRPKRKLLSTRITDVWKPDTCKKRRASRRISSNELSQMTSENSGGTLKVQKIRKPPQKWTPQLDKYLKDGVKRHGQGKWSRILMDYDFEGRTGTMLKDRWRVLMRAHEVG